MKREIIYSCPFVPPEWLAAFGLEPLRFCSRRTVKEPIGRAEGICAFARAFANEVVAGDYQAAIFTTACDQMRRVYDLVAERTCSDIFLMNVPSTWRTEASQQLYRGELERLGRWLCGLGGEIPSNEALAGTMIEYESRRRANAIDGGDGVPLAVIGGPLLEGDLAIFEIVKKAGGAIVLDASETGELGHCDRFGEARLADDAVGELVRAYFEYMPAAWKRPNDQLFEWFAARCSERNVRGVIFHRFVWCDIWHAEPGRIREMLDVPVLELDVDDDFNSTAERTATRIEAFLETLR